MVGHIFRPESFFLMAWAINNAANEYYFEAITPVETVKAPIRDVYKFIKSEPDILMDFTSRILRGLHGMIVRLEGLTFDTAYQKVESLLLYFAKKFGKKTVKGIVIDFPLTHREISSWIGTARETASLEIEKLKKNGIIIVSKRTIIIKDMKKLEKEAELMPEIM
jgi:CRP/FNR family transcriptional regulator